MDLQKDKSNVNNEEMLPMVSGRSLRFSHPLNINWAKCLKSLIIGDSDLMDLQLDKSNVDTKEMFPMA